MSSLSLMLLTLLTLLSISASSASALTPLGSQREWSESLRDMKDPWMLRMLRQRQRPTPRALESGDTRLVVRDRAGTHIFWMHHGRAVDAMLGFRRSYRIREGIFFNEVCTCNRSWGPRRSKAGRSCARHYKPAFYGLIAGSCVAALLALAGLVWAAVACHRRRNQARAFGHKLLIEEAIVDNGEKGLDGKRGLSWAGEDTNCVKNIEKVAL